MEQLSHSIFGVLSSFWACGHVVRARIFLWLLGGRIKNVLVVLISLLMLIQIVNILFPSRQLRQTQLSVVSRHDYKLLSHDNSTNNTIHNVYSPETSYLDHNHTVDTNPRYIHYNDFKVKFALFCVGAQATGTTSLTGQWKRMPEGIASSHELHWFTDDCWKNTEYSYRDMFIYNNLSDHQEIDLFNKYCPMQRFDTEVVNVLTSRAHDERKHDKRYDKDSVIYCMAKAPRQILYPNVANIVVNYFVKYYDTKLVLLLRNPAKRYISGWVAFESHGSTHFRQSLQSNLLKMKHLNQSLTNIYQKHLNETADMWNEVRNEYKYYFYHHLLPHGLQYNNWLRGCYFPQIVQWTHYLDQLNIKHSFKIIQTEHMYRSDDDFQRTMKYLRCYVHSNEQNYDEWMDECVKGDSLAMEFVQRDVGRKTHGFQPTDEEMDILKVSFSTCNHWLYRFLNSHKSASSILLTNQWNWGLWDVSY
eukprot:916121_1